MTDLLELALDDLVPSFAEAQPDWTDVVARARRANHTRSGRTFWRSRPRRTVALVIALLVLVVLATPAFGVQGYVLHLLGRKNVSFSNSPTAPNVVKKQFLDLPIGAPSQFAPRVKAGQAREVATFSIAGHRRKLWVVPTQQGGYCYTFERSFGGCRQKAADRHIGRRGQFGVTWMAASPNLPRAAIVSRVGGDLTSPDAAKITARYADGATTEVPFVWVTRPIAAGFFTYDIPTARWSKPRRLLSLTLYATDGKQLARKSFPYLVHPTARRSSPPRTTTPKTRALPSAPPVVPSAPTQSGSADGFRVVVGHNGAVQFTQIDQRPILTELRGNSAGFGCFRLTKEFGIFTVRGLSQGGQFAPQVGFTLNAVGMPVDGCEVQASIGRTWPDRLHNRAAVEIPLTPNGKTYFRDRAAARDLALFVRSRRMQQLRKEPAPQARAGIVRTYGKQLAHSPITITVVDGKTLKFSEASTTGRRFTVTVRNGRITSQDLRPYAFVF